VTTTPAPSALKEFESGFATALGFADVRSCYNESVTGVDDLWIAAEEYKTGGIVAKAKALAKLASGIHVIMVALEPCSKSMTDAEMYVRLIHYLKDPRYYTWHNALTLALNLAEDHNQLATFAAAWSKGDYRTAGYQIASTALDVLSNPGIPDSNSTEASQIAVGLARGFVSNVPYKCFADASIEIPAVFGGVVDILTGVKALAGFESLFHGLEGIVPCYRQCLADEKKIMDLLQELEDLKHPLQLAEKVLKNIETSGVDISLYTASAVLAYKGGEWENFGLQIGKLLGKVVIIPDTAIVV